LRPRKEGPAVVVVKKGRKERGGIHFQIPEKRDYKTSLKKKKKGGLYPFLA